MENITLRNTEAEFVIKDERELPKLTPQEYEALPQKYKDEYEAALKELE